MLRSSGLATSQTTSGSQEAKDFKVVVTLLNPPDNLRPGLSCTAKITAATRQNTLSMPIQALTVRQRKDLEQCAPGENSKLKPCNQPRDPTKENEEVPGVFVVRDRRAEFVPVETGISGATEVEVTNGLSEGEEIITGSYKILRSLRNHASVKIDNSPPKKEES
jgi:HlyD family secretion protein